MSVWPPSIQVFEEKCCASYGEYVRFGAHGGLYRQPYRGSDYLKQTANPVKVSENSRSWSLYMDPTNPRILRRKALQGSQTIGIAKRLRKRNKHARRQPYDRASCDLGCFQPDLEPTRTF